MSRRKVAELRGTPLNAELFWIIEFESEKCGAREEYECPKWIVPVCSNAGLQSSYKSSTVKGWVKSICCAGIISSRDCKVGKNHRP